MVSRSVNKCSVNEDEVLKRWEYLYLRNQLAATFTTSAFTLIGPYVCYARVHTQAESVCQNCALGRCVFLCSIIVLHFL